MEEVPKWLKELEEKRERRLKARLGHEAGAGSPCLTCEDKCPGLDLHFWRKICKNCKCGKENHDVNDDDIYGWAQFQLLGSKPNKSKKIVLAGRKDAVELDWTPKGQSDTVDLYLKELPVNLLPIKGSYAAQERKQLLQKQIPLHDIDPALCHALSDSEVKQMNDYIAHVKQSSVGIGHIIKLNDLLKKRESLNPHYQMNRIPMQLSQSQHIVLQGSDRSNVLRGEEDVSKNFNHLSLLDLHPAQCVVVTVDNQNPAQISNVRDIHYDPLHVANVEGRPQHTICNVNYPNLPYPQHIDNQTPVNINLPKDLHASMQGTLHQNENKSHPALLPAIYPNQSYAKQHHNHSPYSIPSSKDIDINNQVDKTTCEVYADQNVNFNISNLTAHPNLLGTTNIPRNASENLITYDQQTPQKIMNIKDLAYSTYNPLSPSQLHIQEETRQPTPIKVGAINDIEYPSVKQAEQRQNDFIPDIPRKNVQFNLNDVEILPHCHKCKKMFSIDDFVIGIDRSDALWHADCFQCTGCNQNLADMLYFYHRESDEIYCGRDYAKIKGIPRCQACDELIFVKEYCLAENSTFHVKHFCCFECDKPLAGQNYVMEELQPVCVPCFENIKAEKCKVCSQVIKPDEQGANLNGVHFHANDDCFCCKMCKKVLLGTRVLFKNQNLYCSTPCFAADK
ncbi:hypothetical protein PPYR_14331 [Photinus pyralis]|uniref:Testin n=2 Tax=Photinus pyralis TaxID=7054 RepID=A0A1Y1N5E4_PHOPY|nr:testin [Photinus pyralis]KAB0792372.1 hypothetical protein PPYR_14331 [Photinus pyralis]